MKSTLAHHVLLFLCAVIIAAYFDLMRDATISAAIVFSAGLLALAAEQIGHNWELTYYATHMKILDTVSDSPIHRAPEEAVKAAEYADYCNRMMAENWADDQTDLLLDEYDALPACREASCSKKAKLCMQHHTLNGVSSWSHDFDDIPGKPLIP